ncbi:hypothetical protein H4Q26_001391 [Puccinia striiformis f. sp. tritici PST-130]|nr:hypothetical protein H4Q26_001391 [Puccinia striiformis f. sp. tritici PST-130]
MGLLSNTTDITTAFTNTTSTASDSSSSSSTDLLVVATILSQKFKHGLFYFTWILICELYALDSSYAIPIAMKMLSRIIQM